MTATPIPCASFFFFRHRLGFSDRERRIWFYHSVAAFALLVLLLVLPSSTAVDRLALYVMPLQIAVLSRAPIVFGVRLGTILVLSYSLVVQFVWLNLPPTRNIGSPTRLILWSDRLSGTGARPSRVRALLAAIWPHPPCFPAFTLSLGGKGAFPGVARPHTMS